MTLIRTSFLNAIAVTVKMLSLLGINKLLAIYVGPAGYATVGQFQNIVQFVTTFGSGAINTGVTKFTAEYNEEKDKQYCLWKTSGTIVLLFSIVFSFLLIFFKENISIIILKDAQYERAIFFLGISLPFLALNSLFLAVLNGTKEMNTFVLVNIAGSIVSILVIYVFTINWNLIGVLVALATYQSFSFFITILACKKFNWFKCKNFFGRISSENSKKLLKYSLMAFVTAATVPLTQVAVRWILMQEYNEVLAGYWEAMWRLSSAYLMFITTTLGVYYLPRLSEITNRKELFQEIIYGYKIILPIVALLCCFIYLLRFEIVSLLFSSDFNGMIELFPYQLIGDFLKVGSWLLAFLMISRAMVAEYIYSQILASLSFPLLTYLLIGKYGFSGVALAHTVNYAFYWFLVIYFVLKKYNLRCKL